MGFYCSTRIVDKDDRILTTINTEKYGIGYGRLCFSHEDFTSDIPNRILFAKAPVKKAEKQVQSYYEEIVNKKNQKILAGMKYDNWSERALQKAIDFMEKLLNTFKKYESAYVYADLSESSYGYNSNDEVPTSDDSPLAFLHHVLDGCYIGRYPDEQLWKDAIDFIQSFKEGLLQFDTILSIDNFGTSYDPIFFKVGNQRLMKFGMDLKISNESIEKNYGIFDSVMIPIRPYFLENGCDYERDYGANWILKDGKVRIIIYKLM